MNLCVIRRFNRLSFYVTLEVFSFESKVRCNIPKKWYLFTPHSTDL